ncbi:MAG: twin-arginine translocation signal domain-containing protein, partial [Planctomycetota bacterium]
MSNKLNRRGFLKKSALASAVTVAGLSLDEQTALAKTSSNETAEATKSSNSDLAMGMIKNVKISKLIIGSNLFGGGAHSRDLRYVRDLLDHYFTHEKVMDTLQLCEENGINTSIGGA